MDRVKNKVAIVTGGSQGIGKAISILLAKEGAKVAVSDLNEMQGSEVVKEIKKIIVYSYILPENSNNGNKKNNEIIKKKGVAEFWHMDVTNEDEIYKVFLDVEAKFGQIDILVNNAGISGVNKPTHQVTLKEWQKVIDVNQNGVFLCTKNAIPYMLKYGGGSIINISSIYGLVGAPDEPPYHASKGAVRIMTKTDALFYAKENIRVNSIYPGFIMTPMLENYVKHSQNKGKKMFHQIESLHPIGHIGEPYDIAYGVLYLASDESKFVTGAEFVIDGGYTIK